MCFPSASCLVSTISSLLPSSCESCDIHVIVSQLRTRTSALSFSHELALSSSLLQPSSNTQACRPALLLGRNVRWPRRILPLLSHGEHADETNRQTDRRTDGWMDARPLHYAFRYGRGQRDNVLQFYLPF